MLFVAAEGGKGSLIRLQDKTTHRSYTLGSTQHCSTAFCPLERVLVVFQSRNSAFFFASHTQQPVQRSFTPEQVVSSAVTHCGTFLVCGGASGAVMVWSLRTGQLLRNFRAHLRSVTSISVSTDDSLIVTASEDSVCKVWALASLVALAPSVDVTPLSSFTGHTLSVLCCTFLHNTSMVVSGSADRTCRVFDAATAEQLMMFTVGDSVTALAVSEDDSVLAVGTHSGFLCFHRLTQATISVSGEGASPLCQRGQNSVLPPTEDGHNSPLRYLRFVSEPSVATGVIGTAGTAGGRTGSSASPPLVSVSEGGAVLWYDAASCKLIGEAFPRQRHRIISCAYFPESLADERKLSLPALSKNPVDPTAKNAYGVERVIKRPRKEVAWTSVGMAERLSTVAIREDDSAVSAAEDSTSRELDELLSRNKELEGLRDKMLAKVVRLGA